ncbi:MAG: protein kinase [Myxococcales bacterium]|nr:protein kinase [Myxococcales bacterium]
MSSPHPNADVATPRAADPAARSWGVEVTQRAGASGDGGERAEDGAERRADEALAIDATLHAPPRDETGPRPGDASDDAARSGSAPTTENPLRGAPRTVGRYVVFSRLGEGGMGVVYAAYDPKLDRKVAVKLVRPGPSGSSASDDPTRRLEQEARALAKLSHNNIVRVYEVGTFRDQVFVAMEFVDGVTLREWQFKRAATWRDVLPKYVAAGRGLAAAHRAGIVHRDFKPDNVLVSAEGEVRVLDFGLAARRGGRSRAAGDAWSASAVFDISGDEQTMHAPADRTYKTQAGALVGTPAYMSPEQYLGARVEATSDQFSFCVALYEALYGQRPFVGESLAVLASNIVDGALAETPAFVKVPQWLRRVLLRGLSRAPSDRFPDMDALLRALEHDPRALLRRALVVLAALGLIAAGYLAWQSADRERERSDEGARLRAEFDQARVRAAEAELQDLRARTLSERWDDLVLAHAREQLDRRPEDALAALKHLTPGNTRWLPAARALAGDALRRGIPARRLALAGPARALAFSPDGGALAIAGPEGQIDVLQTELATPPVAGPRLDVPLHALALTQGDEFPRPRRQRAARRRRAAAAGGRARRRRDPALVPRQRRARALVGHAGPARALDFGPDGRVLASAGDDGVVRLWNMSDGSSTNLTDHEGPVLALRWSPDGETLASAGADGSVILWSPARATHVELREHRKPVRELAFVGDGALLSLDAAGHVFEWNLATRRGAERHDLAGARGLHVARGGDTRLTVARDDARVLQFPARSSSRALLGDPARLSAAALSRGGEWAALATSAGELELWSASEETAELLFSPDIMIDRLAFAPDGDALATSNRAGALTLWSLTGGEHQPLTQGGPHHAQLEFSPDGRWLAALSDAHELDRWPRAPDGVAGPRRRWLEQGERFASGPLTWAPDSESVALDHCDTMCVIERVFVDDRPPIRFPRPCFGPPTTLRFSGDGRRLVGDSPRDEAPFVWDFEQARALTARWRPEFDADARRLAIAFVDAGAQLRIATAREQAAGETLRVWSWNLETGRTHLLFEERALRHVSASPNAPTLLLRTGELRNLLWSLDDDRLHVLPTIEGGIVDFLTDLDRSHALIRARGPDSERADIHRLLELETGVERDLPPLHEPIAFSPDRSLADALPRAGVRLWRSAGPEDPARFQEWLAEVTTRELERAAIP